MCSMHAASCCCRLATTVQHAHQLLLRATSTPHARTLAAAAAAACRCAACTRPLLLLTLWHKQQRMLAAAVHTAGSATDVQALLLGLKQQRLLCQLLGPLLDSCLCLMQAVACQSTIDLSASPRALAGAPHEGPVYVDGLPQQLRAIKALDGLARLLFCGILD